MAGAIVSYQLDIIWYMKHYTASYHPVAGKTLQQTHTPTGLELRPNAPPPLCSVDVLDVSGQINGWASEWLSE